MKFWLLDSTWKSTFRRSLVCIHFDRYMYTSSCKRQSIDLRPFQKFSNSREFSRCRFAREYVRDAALILITLRRKRAYIVCRVAARSGDSAEGHVPRDQKPE